MSYSNEMECPNPECGVKLRIIERPMGVPGGKEKEQAFCPKCHTLVDELMTDGFLDAYIIKE